MFIYSGIAIEKIQAMENKQIDEAYLASLSEEELLEEQENWTAKQWQQYYCPNGTMTMEEFRDLIIKKVDEKILEKYGPDYLK